MPEQVMDPKREQERSEEFDEKLKVLVKQAKSSGKEKADIAPVSLTRIGDQFHKSPNVVAERLHTLWMAK